MLVFGLIIYCVLLLCFMLVMFGWLVCLTLIVLFVSYWLYTLFLVLWGIVCFVLLVMGCWVYESVLICFASIVFLYGDLFVCLLVPWLGWFDACLICYCLSFCFVMLIVFDGLCVDWLFCCYCCCGFSGTCCFLFWLRLVIYLFCVWVRLAGWVCFGYCDCILVWLFGCILLIVLLAI